MKPKLPALFAAAILSALTAIACTKTDTVTAAEAPSRNGGSSVEAPAGTPAAKPESAPSAKPKRPLHERARIWLT